MKNPITKLAVTAIIMVAAIAGTLMWTGTNSDIGLANVLGQIQQSAAYRFQMVVTVSGRTPTGQGVDRNTESTILIAQGRMKITMDVAAPNGGKTQPTEIYLLPGEKAMIMLMPAAKQYARLNLDDALLERTRQQNDDPSFMLKRILDCRYESLGRSVIDGVEVEGFETTDPNYMGETSGRVDVKIWIDVKTQLPVRSETDMQAGDMRIHGVDRNFQWNYVVDADTFKPVIPDDYTDIGSAAQPPAIGEETAISSSKLLPDKEEGAIAGLKLCADLTGRYPEKLDFNSVASMIQTEIKKRSDPVIKQMVKEEGNVVLVGKDEKLSPEEEERRMREYLNKKHDQFYRVIVEQSGETTDKLSSVFGVVMFYDRLGEEGKDPAYYGSVVMPKDKDNVLMRWKISDDQYRVIFGSLHAETVDAQTLAELEKDLPK